jgi:hypothetical protein
MSGSKPKSKFNSKNRAKKIRPNFSPRRFFMSKGFKPTEHKKPMPKNLKSALNRVGKELKNALRNPVVIAANLDKKKTD